MCASFTAAGGSLDLKSQSSGLPTELEALEANSKPNQRRPESESELGEMQMQLTCSQGLWMRRKVTLLRSRLFIYFSPLALAIGYQCLRAHTYTGADTDTRR